MPQHRYANAKTKRKRKLTPIRIPLFITNTDTNNKPKSISYSNTNTNINKHDTTTWVTAQLVHCSWLSWAKNTKENTDIHEQCWLLWHRPFYSTICQRRRRGRGEKDCRRCCNTNTLLRTWHRITKKRETIRIRDVSLFFVSVYCAFRCVRLTPMCCGYCLDYNHGFDLIFRFRFRFRFRRE